MPKVVYCGSVTSLDIFFPMTGVIVWLCLFLVPLVSAVFPSVWARLSSLNNLQQYKHSGSAVQLFAGSFSATLRPISQPVLLPFTLSSSVPQILYSPVTCLPVTPACQPDISLPALFHQKGNPDPPLTSNNKSSLNR